MWDRVTGRPVGPGLGWQDLRTVGTCLELQGQGIRIAPNASATKLSAILDLADPDRVRAERGDLAFGTIDTWVAWILSDGELHVTDASNAGVTGLIHGDGTGWSPALLDALRIPDAVLPDIVDSSGIVGTAHTLAGAPPIAGIAGDQQASLVGQSCTRAGQAKATFGTGGMLDQCLGTTRPHQAVRGPAGTIPIIAWRRDGVVTWGIEAIMLSAGNCVEWLRDDLAIIDDAADSAVVASRCADTGDVWFVPALLGLGTPVWDFGARGTFTGITRGSGRPELVRAVLEGVAHRGADLLEAAETDSGLAVETLRVDGGMTSNDVFLGRPGRSVRPAGRGRTGARGHHPGRRLPGRHGHGDLGRRGRCGSGVEPAHRRLPVTVPPTSAGPTVTGGSTPAPAPRAPSPSSRASTSREADHREARGGGSRRVTGRGAGRGPGPMRCGVHNCPTYTGARKRPPRIRRSDRPMPGNQETP